MQKEDNIIVFETYYDPIMAEIIKGKLEANGIPCFLADDNMGVIMPIYNQALGGVKLKIFERDLEKCIAIVAEDDDLQVEEEISAELNCIYCGSSNVRFGPATKEKFSWYSTIISFLFMTYPLPDQSAWHCFNCGKDFTEPKK